MQCWMSYQGIADVSIVEPFIQDSVIGGLREGRSPVKFSNIFNLEAFNHISRAEGAPVIALYSTYLQQAPRRAIFVQFRRYFCKNNCSVPPPELIWAAGESSNECYQLTNETTLVFSRGATVVAPVYHDGHHYCYIRVVRVYHMLYSHQAITSQQFRGVIMGGIPLRGVVLVLSLWRTPWQVGICRSISLNPQKLKDSHHLLRAAEKYKEMFQLVDGEYIGVMLRSEHAYLMIQSHIRFKTPSVYTMKQCLEEVVDKSRAALAQQVDAHRVFVTADVGLFGTNSWNQSVHKGHKQDLPELTQEVQGTVERLYEGSLTFTQWEDSFTAVVGGLEDGGYVAALQRVIVSRAACLVLLGGGSFQRMSLASYLHQTQPWKQCVHLVCMDRAYEAQFKQQIN